jgi:hypothetical protein
MAGGQITPISRGIGATPSMDFETVGIPTPTLVQTVIGHGNPTTLQSITINSAGTTTVQLWKVSGTTSTNVGNINHTATAAVTLWYNAAAQNGWIINEAGGVGHDMTISFRENL